MSFIQKELEFVSKATETIYAEKFRWWPGSGNVSSHTSHALTWACHRLVLELLRLKRPRRMSSSCLTTPVHCFAASNFLASPKGASAYALLPLPDDSPRDCRSHLGFRVTCTRGRQVGWNLPAEVRGVPWSGRKGADACREEPWRAKFC